MPRAQLLAGPRPARPERVVRFARQLLALAVAGAVVPVLPQSDCVSGTLNCAGECCDGAADQRGCNSWSPCEEPDCPWYNQLLNCAGQCCDDAADQRGCSTASPCVGREPCAGNDLILYCSDPPPECNTTVCMEGGAPGLHFYTLNLEKVCISTLKA